MDDLYEKLLISERQTNNTDTLRSRNRLTLVNFKFNEGQLEDNLIESWQKKEKMYHSILEEPNIGWSQQEILQRSLIMDEQATQEPLVFETVKMAQGVSMLRSTQQSHQNFTTNDTETVKKIELNLRLFHMKENSQRILYNFNLLFNIAFRIGLILLVIVLSIYGDGDENEEEQKIFVQVILGLEGFILLFYFIAVTKMLITRSCKISVQFQKQFYEKPYSQIQMERTFRKHFTIKKIIFNFTRFFNPFTKFNRKININLMRQEIYNRMELVFVFIPLLIAFLIGNPWFDQSNAVVAKFNIQLMMAIVLCIGAVRCTVHYIFVYIFF